MPSLTLPVGRGCATGVDPSLLDQGQLQESVGVVYEVSNPAAQKMKGRDIFNSSAVGSPSSITNIQYFDSVSGNPMILVFVGANIYKSAIPATDAPAGAGSFSIITGSPSDSDGADATVFNDTMVVTGANKNYVISGSGAARQLGLFGTDRAQLLLGTGAAGNPNGTYEAWVTEYDSTNGIESANFVGTSSSPSSITTAGAQKITYNINNITATWSNASADKYRIYRTIAGGVYPNGWLVTEQLKSVVAYTDDMSDVDLVTQTPYPIVTINDISESLNWMPVQGFGSLDTFQGSLVASDRTNAIVYSESGLMDAMPESYRLAMYPAFGGTVNCVRTLGPRLFAFFTHETFQINYLPKASDAVFDGGIAQEKVGNYGTPSPNGACMFSGFGNQAAMFFASLNGPMVMVNSDPHAILDRAVANIDWPNTVKTKWLGMCKAIDNPLKQRVELFFVDSDTDTTSYSALHFYYDSERLTHKAGSLPELAWTGPHKVPGKGCFGVQRVSNGNGRGAIYTGDARANGTVYQEDVAFSDEALLVDSSGTINFRLRTSKVYPVGLDGEARADRLHIHKSSDNTDAANPDYTVTFTAHREEDGAFTTPIQGIKAQTAGLSSMGLNTGFRGFDVRITYDGTTAMPPINNITLRYKDTEEFSKTTRG